MTGTIRIQVGTFCEAPRPSVQGNQVRPGFSHGGVFRRMKDCKGLPGYLACFVRSCSENASNFKNLPNPAVGFTDLLGFLGIIFNQRCHLICLEMAWWIPGRLCWLDLQLKVGPEGFMVVLYGAVSVFVLKRTMNSVFFCGRSTDYESGSDWKVRKWSFAKSGGKRCFPDDLVHDAFARPSEENRTTAWVSRNVQSRKAPSNPTCEATAIQKNRVGVVSNHRCASYTRPTSKWTEVASARWPQPKSLSSFAEDEKPKICVCETGFKMWAAGRCNSFGDLSWSKRAKQYHDPMSSFFSPLSITMNDWHLDEFYCFRSSAIADPVVFLRCFLSPFCMCHHEEQQAEVASSLSRTHGIEMKAASMKWISLLRKSHTSWFGLTFSTVTRKKKQNAGSTSKAKAYVLFVRIGSICTWRPWRKPNQIRCFSSLAPSIKSLCMEPLLLCD